MKLLNDARFRSVVAGAVGGVLGWLLAELALAGQLTSNSASSFAATFLATFGYGALAGLGVGAILGVAEGLVIQSWDLARRGLLIGLAVGAAGGALGAGCGQLGFASTSSAQGSMFSSAMQERLTGAAAKKGDIEIGLLWNNTNDLDLHVVDPTGERIFFYHKVASSGGELDVDRNANCQQDVTDKPVEHVVWPVGKTPPLGRYEIMVNHYANCGPPDPTPFQVELVLAGATDNPSFSGQINHSETKTVHSFTWNGTAGTAASGIGALLAKIAGWTIFGALVGCAEGFRRRSVKAARNAALGGSIGGAMGGLVFVVIEQTGFGDIFARLLGLVILGACIGLWIVLIERALSAVLAIKSGWYEGREIFLDKQEMRIGRNDVFEIYLGGDSEIRPHHATLRQEGSAHVLLPVDGQVLVNGSATTQGQLHDGDAIVIGSTRMTYKQKASKSERSGDTPTGDVRPSAPRRRPPPPPPPRKSKKSPKR